MPTAKQRASVRKASVNFGAVFQGAPAALAVVAATGEFQQVNDRFVALFNSSKEELLSTTIQSVASRQDLVPEEQLARLTSGEADSYSVETLCQNCNATSVWVNFTFFALRPATAETAMTLIVAAEDRTAFREMEAKEKNWLRESEEKFAKAFRCSPQPFTLSTVLEDRYLDVNEAFELKTGYTREEALGHTTEELGIWEHRADREKLVERALRGEKISNVECRFRKKNGEIFIGLLSAEIIEGGIGGVPCMVANVLDITEWKRSQEAVVDLSRRLIVAHEEERTFIARELHDDINQRIALLSVELDRLKENLPDSAVASHQHISQCLSDLGKDIQALSHRLHSSKLEYLGIVTAAKSFCKEFSDQRKVEVDFTHAGVPRDLPKEISLCLFRVLQEALQNAVKHSEVRHFKVELRGTAEEIQLFVSDSGRGFDPTRATASRGLGLVSMHERVRMIDGQLTVDSQPNCGTTIRVRAPVKFGESCQETAV